MPVTSSYRWCCSYPNPANIRNNISPLVHPYTYTWALSAYSALFSSVGETRLPAAQNPGVDSFGYPQQQRVGESPCTLPDGARMMGQQGAMAGVGDAGPLAAVERGCAYIASVSQVPVLVFPLPG